MGLKPGPQLGALLAEIREQQLQDELTTVDEARAWVQEKLRAAGAASERSPQREPWVRCPRWDKPRSRRQK